MPVQVDDHDYFDVLGELRDFFFGLPHLWVVELVTAYVLAV